MCSFCENFGVIMLTRNMSAMRLNKLTIVPISFKSYNYDKKLLQNINLSYKFLSVFLWILMEQKRHNIITYKQMSQFVLVTHSRHRESLTGYIEIYLFRPYCLARTPGISASVQYGVINTYPLSSIMMAAARQSQSAVGGRVESSLEKCDQSRRRQMMAFGICSACAGKRCCASSCSV